MTKLLTPAKRQRTYREKINLSGHGYLCPACRTTMKTKDSRSNADGTVRRRRVCPSCSHRLFTIEVPAAYLPTATDLAALTRAKDTLISLTSRLQVVER